jgi:hypothetical protein
LSEAAEAVEFRRATARSSVATGGSDLLLVRLELLPLLLLLLDDLRLPDRDLREGLEEFISVVGRFILFAGNMGMWRSGGGKQRSISRSCPQMSYETCPFNRARRLRLLAPLMACLMPSLSLFHQQAGNTKVIV